MSSFFHDEPGRRNINLGGASRFTHSGTSIIDQAKARRVEREERKRRTDSATRIQAWWRGRCAAMRVRQAIKASLSSGSGTVAIGSLDGLRSIALVGSDDEVLDLWAQEMQSAGEEALFTCGTTDQERQSWVVLMRQIAELSLRSAIRRPTTEAAAAHLRLISALLSNTTASKHLGHTEGPTFVQSLLSYLLLRRLYSRKLTPLITHLTSALAAPKQSNALASLINIATAPLQSLPSSSPQSPRILAEFVSSILSIPHILARIPLPALTMLSARIPFFSLHLLLPTPSRAGPFSPSLVKLSIASKLHLLAHLHALTAPRYTKLSPAALDAYLRLSVLIMHSIPMGAGDPPLAKPKGGKPTEAMDVDEDEDGDENRIFVTVLGSTTTSTQPTPKLPVLDAKTLKRLSSLTEPTHITSLLSVLSSSRVEHLRQGVITYLLTVTTSFPARKDRLLATVLVHSPALVRELYRNYVRSSPLGKDSSSESSEGLGVLVDPGNAVHWPAMVFLAELYAHALRTMGDDEFFGSARPGTSLFSQSTLAGGQMLGSSSASPAQQDAGPGSTATLTSIASTSSSSSSKAQQRHRNPLTLDELGTFSRQMLGAAFVLYYYGAGAGKDSSWEGVDLRRLVSAADPETGTSSGGTLNGQGMAMDVDSEGGVKVTGHFTWDMVRERLTGCLVGVHARDSRKSFLPKDHWLISSTKIDLDSFVEAAIYEEQQLSHSSEDDPPPPTGRKAPSQAFSKRQIAHLSPRLGVLNNIPFAIPFETRVAIFRSFVYNDVVLRQAASSSAAPIGGISMGGMGAIDMIRGRRGALVSVRRGRVAQDGFDRLEGVDLKGPVQVTFVDQFGNEEAGIDGGGVFKEFFTSLCKEVFDTDRGLWLETQQRELYPNPHAYATEAHSLNWYRFIGRILGKAMYEGILVDVAFAGFFLAKWLKKQSFLDDLVSLDPALYAGLVYLKHYEGDPEELSLNFTVAIEEFGATRTLDLIPNGSATAVTRENRLQYIHLVSHYRLSRQIKLQSEAFFEGLSEMIKPGWLRMFNQQELQILLGGANSPVDVQDLENHTQYGGLYDRNHETIIAFWKVVNDFNQEQRRSLLRFVTSCSRPPLLGFKELVPNFAIRDAGEDQYRLPTASTCVNLLKLPRYKNEGILREKLLHAINANAGFDLS